MTASASAFICAAFSRSVSIRLRRSSTTRSRRGSAIFAISQYSTAKQTMSQKIWLGKVWKWSCGIR